MDVDRRRLGLVVVASVLTALTASSIVLFVVGAHHNSQIDELQRGVPVEATVSNCLGLLGGSGSNAAGYSCLGTYVVDGHRYSEPIPSSSAQRVGSRVPLIAARGDLALVATPAQLRNERSSWRVFVLPSLLLVLVLLLAVTALVLRRRTGRPEA